MSLPALDRLRDLDHHATSRLRAIPIQRAGHVVLTVFAHSGDSAVLVPVLALLWWTDRFSRQSIVVPLAIGYMVSVLLTALLKYSVRRRRPKGEWGALYRRTDPHSFPSGHASRTAALAVVALACDAILGGILLLAWALAVGFARIALGVHFVLDVLAGYLLGLVVGLALWPWIARGMPGLPPFPW